jgi:hypothetical protein
MLIFLSVRNLRKINHLSEISKTEAQKGLSQPDEPLPANAVDSPIYLGIRTQESAAGPAGKFPICCPI